MKNLIIIIILFVILGISNVSNADYIPIGFGIKIYQPHIIYQQTIITPEVNTLTTGNVVRYSVETDENYVTTSMDLSVSTSNPNYIIYIVQPQPTIYRPRNNYPIFKPKFKR